MPWQQVWTINNHLIFSNFYSESDVQSYIIYVRMEGRHFLRSPLVDPGQDCLKADMIDFTYLSWILELLELASMDILMNAFADLNYDLT